MQYRTPSSTIPSSTDPCIQYWRMATPCSGAFHVVNQVHPFNSCYFRPELEFAQLLSGMSMGGASSPNVASITLCTPSTSAVAAATASNISGSSIPYPLQNGFALDVAAALVGSGPGSGSCVSACEWRISHVNKDFGVCATYGATLIVPKAISDEQLALSAAFRDGGRFPVLSYKHENGVRFYCIIQLFVNNRITLVYSPRPP